MYSTNYKAFDNLGLNWKELFQNFASNFQYLKKDHYAHQCCNYLIKLYNYSVKHYYKLNVYIFIHFHNFCNIVTYKLTVYFCVITYIYKWLIKYSFMINLMHTFWIKMKYFVYLCDMWPSSENIWCTKCTNLYT